MPSSAESPRLVVQYVLSDRPARSHYECWSGTELVDAGSGEHDDPDLILTRSAELDAADHAGRAAPEVVVGRSRIAVRLSNGATIDDLFPPPHHVVQDLDVFDPEQRTTAHVRCLGSPFGDVSFSVAVHGRQYTVAPLLEAAPSEIEFSLDFSYFLHWLHLESYLGPALWRSGTLFGGPNLFLLSLLDGVVCAGSASKGHAREELLEAATRLRRYAACRLAARSAHVPAAGAPERQDR